MRPRSSRATYDQARKAYAKARKLLAGDPVAEAELFLREGRLREGSAGVSQALRHYRRGLKAIGTRRSPEARSVRARLVLAEGATRLHGGKHRQALPLLEQAVREAERAGDRATLAHAYYLLDWAHTDLGNPEAQRYRDLALPIFEDLGDFDKQGRVLTNLGVNAYHEGRWDEALELYERARAASEQAGDEIGASFNLNNVAEIRLEQGRVDEAELLLREVLATWRASGFAFGIGVALRNLGRDRDAPRRARARRRAVGSRARDPGQGRHRRRRLRARRLRREAAAPRRRPRGGEAPGRAGPDGRAPG